MATNKDNADQQISKTAMDIVTNAIMRLNAFMANMMDGQSAVQMADEAATNAVLEADRNDIITAATVFRTYLAHPLQSATLLTLTADNELLAYNDVDDKIYKVSKILKNLLPGMLSMEIEDLIHEGFVAHGISQEQGDENIPTIMISVIDRLVHGGNERLAA